MEGRYYWLRFLDESSEAQRLGVIPLMASRVSSPRFKTLCQVLFKLHYRALFSCCLFWNLMVLSKRDRPLRSTESGREKNDLIRSPTSAGVCAGNSQGEQAHCLPVPHSFCGQHSWCKALVGRIEEPQMGFSVPATQTLLLPWWAHGESVPLFPAPGLQMFAAALARLHFFLFDGLSISSYFSHFLFPPDVVSQSCSLLMALL